MVGLGWVPPWWRRLVRLSAPLGRSSDHESAFAFAFVRLRLPGCPELGLAGLESCYQGFGHGPGLVPPWDGSWVPIRSTGLGPGHKCDFIL